MVTERSLNRNAVIGVIWGYILTKLIFFIKVGIQGKDTNLKSKKYTTIGETMTVNLLGIKVEIAIAPPANKLADIP